MSTHALPEKMAEWTVKRKAFDVVLTVCNFSIDKNMEDAIAAVAQTGTGVVGMKVMAGGFRSVKSDDPIAKRLHRDGAMLAALKWVLNKPLIGTTIPSMTDMDQLDENLRAMAETFSPADGRVLLRAPGRNPPALLPHVRAVQWRLRQGPAGGRHAAHPHLC